MYYLLFYFVLFYLSYIVISKGPPRDECCELALAISTMVHAWDDCYFSFIRVLVYLSLTNKTLNKNKIKVYERWFQMYSSVFFYRESMLKAHFSSY